MMIHDFERPHSNPKAADHEREILACPSSLDSEGGGQYVVRIAAPGGLSPHEWVIDVWSANGVTQACARLWRGWGTPALGRALIGRYRDQLALPDSPR